MHVQFSRPVMSNSLRPHDLQHARPPCPTPTPKVHPCLLSQWCHPTTSSSVVPFSSCPQSFPASVSFQMSQLFASGGQSFGVSASTSVLSVNTQDWSPFMKDHRWALFKGTGSYESKAVERRANQSILKEISPGCSLEEPMLKLKLQYFGHLMWRADSLEKTPMLGKIEGRKRRERQRIRWLDGIIDSMYMSLSKL